MPHHGQHTTRRRARRRALPVAALALALLLGVVHGVDAQVSPLLDDLGAPLTGGEPTSYQPVAPARLLDTRSGGSTVDGQSLGTGRVGPGQSVTVPVAGRGGVPATGAGAVVLNITGVAASAGTWVTVHPAGSARPTASNLNLTAGETRPNAVITALGANGSITLYNAAGTVDLVVDVMGWFPYDGGIVGTQPSRLLDTRSGGATIDGTSSGTGALGAGSVRPLKVAGRAGIPLSGVAAVVLNVTATSPTADTWLTVFPTGRPQPTASNLNMRPGQTVANLVVAQVGSDGRVSIANAFGSTHVIVDVAGWLPAGMQFTGLTPARLADTRPGASTIDQLFAGLGRLTAGARLTLPVAGRAGIPADGVSAAILNVTATGATADTYLTVFEGGGQRPFASNLNVRPGATAPNLVVAPVGPDGTVEIYNASGLVHVIVDVLGWIAEPPPPTDPEDPTDPDEPEPPTVPGDDPTVAIPGNLQDLVLSPDGTRAYVTDVDQPAIELVDVTHGLSLGAIALPTAPSSIDLSPDGTTLYATLPATKQLAVLDVGFLVLPPILPLPTYVPVPVTAEQPNNQPQELAVASDDSVLVVLEPTCCSNWNDRVLRYHPATGAFTDESVGVPFGGTSASRAAASRDRTQIAIANWDGMSVFDVTSGSWVHGRSNLSGWSTLSGDGDGDTWMGGFGLSDDLPLRLGSLPAMAYASALSDDGGLAYGVLAPEVETDPWITVVETEHFRSTGRVSLPDATTHEGQMALTPDGDTLVLATAHGVSIVDADTDRPPRALTSATPGATVPIAGNVRQLATDPDGITVYATNAEANEVDVISLVTGTVVDRIPVGSIPDGIDISDDGSTLYVVNAGGSDVSKVDLATREEAARTPLYMAYSNYPDVLVSVWAKDIAVAGVDGFVTTDSFPGYHLDLTAFLATPIAAGTPNRDLFMPVEAEASEDKSIIAFHEYAGGATVLTWDAAERKLVAAPATGFGYAGLALTPDGGMIATSGVIAQPDGRILGTSQPDAAQAGGMAFARDGSRVYRLADDVITVTETAHFRHVGNIPLPAAAPTTAASPDLVLSRDGTRLVSPAGAGVNIVLRAGVIPLDAPPPPTGSATVLVGGPIGGLVVDPASQIAYASRPDRNVIEVVSLPLKKSIGQILVGSLPTDLDLSADGRYLYVVNTGADDLSVVDTLTRTEVRRIPIPREPLNRPYAIAMASNGKAIVYSGRYGYGSAVFLIDVATGVGARVPASAVRYDQQPMEPQASGDHTKVILPGGGDPWSEVGVVAVYDATTGTWSRRATGSTALWQPTNGDRTGTRWVAGSAVIGGDLHRQGELPTPYVYGADGPWGAALRSDGTVAYRLNDGRVDVIELEHFRRTHTIPTTDDPAPPNDPWYPYDTATGDLVLSPDDSTLVAVTRSGLTITRTADAVPVVPPKLTGQAEVLLQDGPADLVIDQAGAFVYTASSNDNSVEVIDVAQRKHVATIRVASAPTTLDLSADGTRLYVVNRGSGSVSVIDTALRKELRRIELPVISHGRSVTSIAVAADGVAFLGLDEKPYLLRMDLATDAIAVLEPPLTANHPQYRSIVRSSVDKSTVARLGPSQGDQLVARYDAATHTWLDAGLTGWSQDPALDRTGDRIAFGNVVTDRSLQTVASLTETSWWHTLLSPDGSRLFRIDSNKLWEYSPTTGQRVRRYILPVYAPESYNRLGTVAALTNDGQTLILEGGGGLMIREFPDIYEIDEAYE